MDGCVKPGQGIVVETAGVRSRRNETKIDGIARRCLGERFCERYEIDDRTRGYIALILVQDDEPIRLHDRGQDGGPVMRVFERDEAVGVAFEEGPQIVAPARLLAVGKTGAKPRSV